MANLTQAQRAALASAFIFPGAGLMLLGQRLRGAIFALPAAAIMALLVINLLKVAVRLNAELQAAANQGNLALDITYLWQELHRAVFASPYWVEGKWLLLAAWLLSIASSYFAGKKLDLAAAKHSS